MAVRSSWMSEAESDLRSGVAEFGEGMSEEWLGGWMRKWRLHERVLEPGFAGFITRAVAKMPKMIRAPFFILLSTAVEKWKGPKTSSPVVAFAANAAKHAVTALLRVTPGVMDEMIRDGEIDPDNIEVGLGKFLKDGWDKIHNIFNHSDSGDTMADPAAGHATGDDKKKPEHKVDPKAAAEAAAKATASAVEAEEKRYQRQRAEEREARIPGLSRQRAENLALYERIMELYFTRDQGPAPYRPYSEYALMQKLEHCPGAIKFIPWNLGPDFNNAERAINFLETLDRQIKAGRVVGSLQQAARLQEMVIRSEVALTRALNHFGAFSTAMRIEGWRHLTGWQQFSLPMRDRVDRWSTPESREAWRVWFANLRTSRWWPVIAAVIAVAALFTPLVTGFLSLLFASWEVTMAIAAGASLIAWSLDFGVPAAWAFTFFSFMVIIWRLPATVGDRGLEILRSVRDFFSLTDGTGLIGGTASGVVDGLRSLVGMEPRTAEEKAAKSAKIEVETDNIAAIKGYVSTISLGTSAIMVLMFPAFMSYKHFTVIPSIMLTGIALAYFGAELLTRARYVLRAIDEKRSFSGSKRSVLTAAMLGHVSSGVGFIMVLLAVLFVFFGPKGADDGLTLTQGLGSGGVQYIAETVEIPLNEADAVCYADRDLYEAQVAAAGAPGYCKNERNKLKYPCKCDAYDRPAPKVELVSVR